MYKKKNYSKHIILKITKTFLLRLRAKKGCTLSALLFKMVLDHGMVGRVFRGKYADVCNYFEMHHNQKKKSGWMDGRVDVS